MYSLILDSGNINLVVGLAEDGKVIDQIVYQAWQKQSELMIPEIEKILKNNNVSPKEIGEIHVTKGPGSYTGIRIALTIAKIYAMTLGIPCYAYSSLKVLQKEGQPSICLMNARSQRSYFGVYKDNETIVLDKVLPNSEVMKYIEDHPDYAVCGGLNYLGLEVVEQGVIENMLRLKNEEDKVKDILALKAIYLKD